MLMTSRNFLNLFRQNQRSFEAIRSQHSKMSKSFLVTKNFPAKYFGELNNKYKIERWEGSSSISRAEFLKLAKGKEGLLVTLTDKIDEELLDAAGPNLKVVSTLSVGYDHIDVEACKKRGVLLGNTPGVLTDAMAELTMALTLATIRRFHEATRILREGTWKAGWEHFFMNGTSIKDSVVGFVGAGRIGEAVMKRCLPFEPSKILYSTRNRYENLEKLYGAEHASLPDICAKSDILIVICSLNPSTRHLISAEQFKLMKPTAVLINTSRGAVVDQKALYDALKSKQIFAAGLDVMEVEPIPLDDPLLTLDNILLLPHIGSASTSTREAMLYIAIDNLVAGIEGKPLRASIY